MFPKNVILPKKVLKFRILLACLFLVQISWSQDYPNLLSNSAITTIAYWEIGDKARYHCTQESVKFKNEKAKPKETVRSEYDLTLTVMEQTDSSYHMKMNYSNFKSEDMTEMDREMRKIFNQLSIHYATDEMGGFDSITNKKELSQTIDDILDKILNDMGLEDESRDIFDKLRKTLTDMENIEFFFIDDIVAIHGMYGNQFKLNQTEEYDLIYPMFNGFEITGKGHITLNSIDKTRNNCRFSTVQKPNKEEIKKLLVRLVRAFGGEEVDLKDLKDVKFDSTMKATYEMELSSGWMQKISTKNVALVSNKKEETKTVTTVVYSLK